MGRNDKADQTRLRSERACISVFVTAQLGQRYLDPPRPVRHTGGHRHTDGGEIAAGSPRGREVWPDRTAGACHSALKAAAGTSTTYACGGMWGTRADGREARWAWVRHLAPIEYRGAV